MLRTFAWTLAFAATLCTSTPVLYDGRAPINYTAADINVPKSPYVYVVKGSDTKTLEPYDASNYVSFSKIIPASPLWGYLGPERAVNVKIDNSSVFIPGANINNAQWGFRRTEIIAQNDRTVLENGTTVFHFSILKDDLRPLNLKHEYQIVFIEPDDGSHVFGVRIGSNFAAPQQAHLPTSNAKNLEIVDHALNVLYSVEFQSAIWYNFAVQVDWVNLTLGVFASKGPLPLERKTKKVVANSGVTAGALGDFHFGVLKLPLANPKDTLADQGDVVHKGIQEGTTEGLYYSGVFVESAAKGVSAGYGKVIPAIH